MKDRVPKYPGRVLITPEDGSAAFYATVTRADEPVEVGTPINKAALLSDDTAKMLGFTTDDDPTVSDGLATLATKPADAAMSSDFYLYFTGQHPVLNAGLYNDYFDYK